MTKTLLSGAAALAFILAAPHAFAQDAKMKTTVEVEADNAVEDAMDDAADAAEDAMDAAEDMADDAADAADDMADHTMDAADDAMDEAADAIDDAADATADAVDDAIDADADVDVDVRATVACPEGTEAQDDGSCMITGDWSPED
ncbi:hypothetical protein ACFFUB_14915 [Algimonas porphyrae]|uniref:Uncharacterized protein n=1 Tax=Algimonas porphyrae TaxID=1128113 RepID=A0ABQ5UXR4_9PROT|nr:hypothetical protein [Algimonas porphyrae]GLQ19719.1 hypothetical protein GCM10007854_06740 [Algimonas porphyrae]